MSDRTIILILTAIAVAYVLRFLILALRSFRYGPHVLVFIVGFLRGLFRRRW